MCNWLWLCLQLAHATERKEDEDKGDRGMRFLSDHYLISVFFLCIRAKRVTSVPSLLYFLLRSVHQRGWDQRAPALPLTFTSNQFYLITTLQLLHNSYGRANVSVPPATYFSCWFCEEAKATLVPLHSQIFHAVPEHVGFNIELKWICQMKVSVKYQLSLTDMCKKH